VPRRDTIRHREGFGLLNEPAGTRCKLAGLLDDHKHIAVTKATAGILAGT